MPDYDIVETIARVEDEMMDSMIRNLSRHHLEEIVEKMNWEQWQVVMLAELEKYKKRNAKKYGTVFENINSRIESLIRKANENGQSEQEKKILEAIRKGFKGYRDPNKGLTAQFFHVNDRKMEALINATINDMQKAETAILRMANDQFRRIIFDAQVYAATGAATYQKAVDMATKDMLAAGLNCVEYKNGARHRLDDYAEMAIRTASKRAYLSGEGVMRQKWGISLVIINKRQAACPKCAPFVGKIMIDDVWSGGSREDGEYPLMSEAVAAGLYHPRCKDAHSTYFKGISRGPGNGYTQEELEDLQEQSSKEAKLQYAERQVEKYERLEKYSLDEKNISLYVEKISSLKRIINMVRKHTPTRIDMLNNKHINEILNIYNSAPSNIDRINKKYFNSILIVNEHYIGTAFHGKEGIYFNINKDYKNKIGRWKTIFHEIGHRIDFEAGYISVKNKKFRRLLEKDFNNLVNQYKLMYNINTEEAYKEISDLIRTNEYHSISDICGGLTGNKCSGTSKHKTEYWKDKTKLPKEAFAHFYEATARRDEKKIEAIKVFFPESYSEFERMVDSI